MHPTNPGLWKYAADYKFDSEGDMKSARSYMQRGLRFCERSQQLWLEYAELEMRYLRKLAQRRQILGMDIKPASNEGEAAENDAMGDDIIALPGMTAEDMDPELAKAGAESEEALKNLAATPLFTGGIPIAIFDAAMKQFDNDPALASRFFDTVADYSEVPACSKILQHIVDAMQAADPDSPESVICDFKLPCAGIPRSSLDYPSALGESLRRIGSRLEEPNGGHIAAQAIKWLLPALMDVDLDKNIGKVVKSSVRRYLNVMGLEDSLVLIRTIDTENDATSAKALLRLASKQFGSNDQLEERQLTTDTKKG